MKPRDKIGIESKQILFNKVKNLLPIAHKGDQENFMGLDVKLNKPFSLYNCIRGFINIT